MIRLGIVGSNYGRTVQLPAFRADPRCEVIALAGSDAARTAARAHDAGVPKAYGDWRALVEDEDVQAVAIATLAEPASADRNPRTGAGQARVRREADGERPRRCAYDACGRPRSAASRP